jgi:hypothetical protein
MALREYISNSHLRRVLCRERPQTLITFWSVHVSTAWAKLEPSLSFIGWLESCVSSLASSGALRQQ